MKNGFLRPLTTFLFVWACANAGAANLFLSPIPVQYVGPNEDLVLDMHRFYQPADDSKLEFSTVPDLDLAFDAATFQLHVRTTKTGLFDVVISAATGKHKLSTVLTLASATGSPVHHFVFKPDPVEASVAATTEVSQPTQPPPQKQVYLAGSFNGWSTTKTQLTGPDADGKYSADLPLAPGRYSYKLVIDGKWTLDPGNSQTEDNGMGDKNNVLVIGAETLPNPASIYAEQLTADKLIVRTAAPSDGTDKFSAVIEDEVGAAVVPIKKDDGNHAEVAIPPNRNGFIRVIAATADGTPTNVVRCAIGSSKSFRWQDAVMYYALTDRFADGDKSNDHPVDNPKVAWPANYHGGDWKGIRDRIENGYFSSLGINAVWIAPLNKNPAGAYQESPEPHRWYTGYHGYWPISPNETDPHFGTAADLRALIETAHKHGIKVIADLVLHHVHQEHPWWKQHRDWFGNLELPDGRKNLRLWDEQQFTTWFEPYLPSFDFSKDAPVRALIDNSIWWANTYKLDGFRLDAVKHILPSFWWKFRAALRDGIKRNPDSPFYLVGETFKDRAGIVSFIGPNMLDGQFDFPLYDQIQETWGETKGDMPALDDALRASEKAFGKETLMSPLIGNHDKGRFMAYADGELPDPGGTKDEEVGWKNPPKIRDPHNYNKIELAQAFLMSIDGVPMIYYGDEIAMTGAGDPDNRRDMRFGSQVAPDEQRVLDNFKKLAALRAQHPALRWGSRRTVKADHDLYAFVRAHLADRVAVVFNRGKTDAKIDIDVAPELADGDYVDGLSGKKLSVASGKLTFDLPAQTAAFVTKTLNKTAPPD